MGFPGLHLCGDSHPGRCPDGQRFGTQVPDGIGGILRRVFFNMVQWSNWNDVIIWFNKFNMLYLNNTSKHIIYKKIIRRSSYYIYRIIVDEEWYPFFGGLKPPNNSSGGQDKHHWDDGENCCATVTIHWKPTPKNSEKIRRNYLWNWYPPEKTLVCDPRIDDWWARHLDRFGNIKILKHLGYYCICYYGVYQSLPWCMVVKTQLRCAITPSSFFFCTAAHHRYPCVDFFFPLPCLISEYHQFKRSDFFRLNSCFRPVIKPGVRQNGRGIFQLQISV